MNFTEYKDKVSGRKGNCWLLARGWLRETGHDEFINAVNEYAKKNGWHKATRYLLNPSYLQKWFPISTEIKPGDLAVLRSKDNTWGFAIVSGDRQILTIDKGRYTTKDLIHRGMFFRLS